MRSIRPGQPQRASQSAERAALSQTCPHRGSYPLAAADRALAHWHQPATLTIERAAAAQADAITVFTIGPGDNVEAEALARIASRPEYFYRAPDVGDLAPHIHATVAATLPCPPGTFWGAR
jgi:hypothetical protein